MAIGIAGGTGMPTFGLPSMRASIGRAGPGLVCGLVAQEGGAESRPSWFAVPVDADTAGASTGALGLPGTVTGAVSGTVTAAWALADIVVAAAMAQ